MHRAPFGNARFLSQACGSLRWYLGKQSTKDGLSRFLQTCLDIPLHAHTQPSLVVLIWVWWGVRTPCLTCPSFSLHPSSQLLPPLEVLSTPPSVGLELSPHHPLFLLFDPCPPLFRSKMAEKAIGKETRLPTRGNTERKGTAIGSYMSPGSAKGSRMGGNSPFTELLRHLSWILKLGRPLGIFYCDLGGNPEK